jgi:hypothetical protein
VVGGQSQGLDELAAARALHGDDRQGAVEVLDLDALRGVGLQPADHLAAVRGVRDEEHLVLAAHVGDEVVDDAAAGLVAAQGVLRLPVPTLRRSFVSRSLTKSTADGPRAVPSRGLRTTPLPRWLTSKTPTASRTARAP